MIRHSLDGRTTTVSSVLVRELLADFRERGYLEKQSYMILTQPVNGVELVMEKGGHCELFFRE